MAQNKISHQIEQAFISLVRSRLEYCDAVRDPYLITAELGRAPAVVKVTLQIKGKTEFSGSRPAKTTAVIKMKCGIIDYVGEGPHVQKLVAVGLLGASPHIGDMYLFGVLPITFST